MKKDKSVLIIGGDKRQRVLSGLLSDDGYKVTHINENAENTDSAFSDNDIIYLPLPVSRDRVYISSDNSNFKLELCEIVSAVKEKHIVFGGGIPKGIREHFEEENIEYHDCLMSELFELQNARFTSQGALKLLLDNTEECLKGKNVLITGYGRIASALSEILKNLQMKVTVTARNDIQLKTAELSGCETIRLMELENISGFDFIFNTVPYRIFDESAVSSAYKNCVYFELASAPFGADKEHFEKYGIKYIQGGSLPGKLLAVSSAVLLKEYMEQFV